MSADIRLDGVGVRADGRWILQDVSLRVTAPRTAVLGANGSGKSTFARLLNGLQHATTGSVRVGGLDPVRDAREVRRRVGFVFADPEAQILMPTPAEDVALSLRAGRRGAADPRVGAVLDRYGLGGLADAPAAELSGGEKQLLALAAVLATEPDLVVADEPTTRLDLRNTRRIAELLLGLRQPLVLVTHDLDLALRCDEAVLFEDGRVVAVGSPDAVVSAYVAQCA
ncbi:energy-coupling factor ABC transporter ATP-binding protein [Microbacterium resistens]|uniref:energy-coupling factor ABC transporter ATP-binding protein n=1 Tax=Microbacterium resistens TaxID=156977 RepID=UPI00082E3DBB|nr:ABC transporter ATP-binding protein [Microbacterium resistens]MBW1640987.1 ABC transporter ATP-binding protein [Microbacterium resistens]